MRLHYHLAAAALGLGLAACGSSEESDGANRGAAATPAAGGGSEMKLSPGEWEMTSQMVSDLPGMDDMPDELKAAMTGPKTFRVCITPEQAENPGGNVFGGPQEGAKCNHDDLTMAGGRIGGTITCKGGATGKIVMAMDGRFEAESYEISMKLSSDDARMPAMETRGTGRRLGDCPAGKEG